MNMMNYSCKTKTLLHHSALFCFFCCCCCCCLLCLHQSYTTSNHSPLSFSLSENKFVFNLKAHNYFKNIEKNNILEISGGERGARRLLLGGPGSSPPRCTLKCSGCMPCKPVHVPVPPGTRVTTEYYPEAWRCKCGNKFYMP